MNGNMALDTFQLLFMASSVVFYNAWPLLLLAPLNKKKSRDFLVDILAVWVLCLFLRILAAFDSEPIKPFFIGDPLNTGVFALVGVGLFALYFLRRIRKQRVFARKTDVIRKIDDMFNLSDAEFEDFVVKIYQAAGHEAKRTGKVGDNGVDIVIQAKNGEKWIAQCKRWHGSVGEPIVRDFYGALQHEKAHKGHLITTGRFTRPAQVWAKGKPISLYDGEKLIELWEQARIHKAT